MSRTSSVDFYDILPWGFIRPICPSFADVLVGLVQIFWLEIPPLLTQLSNSYVGEFTLDGGEPKNRVFRIPRSLGLTVHCGLRNVFGKIGDTKQAIQERRNVHVKYNGVVMSSWNRSVFIGAWPAHSRSGEAMMIASVDNPALFPRRKMDVLNDRIGSDKCSMPLFGFQDNTFSNNFGSYPPLQVFFPDMSFDRFDKIIRTVSGQLLVQGVCFCYKSIGFMSNSSNLLQRLCTVAGTRVHKGQEVVFFKDLKEEFIFLSNWPQSRFEIEFPSQWDVLEYVSHASVCMFDIGRSFGGPLSQMKLGVAAAYLNRFYPVLAVLSSYNIVLFVVEGDRVIGYNHSKGIAYRIAKVETGYVWFYCGLLCRAVLLPDEHCVEITQYHITDSTSKFDVRERRFPLSSSYLPSFRAEHVNGKFELFSYDRMPVFMR